MADFKLSYTASEINEKLGKVTTPDWNQENPTGKGYIKNKPFGTMNGTVEFLNNGVSTSAATYESGYEGPKFGYLKDLKLNLTVGESYTAILTRQDGSTEEVSIIALPIDMMDDDAIDDILYSILDPMDELDIGIDQIIGLDSVKQKLKDDIVLFSDETSELFMGFSGVWADFENYILKYEPFTTTYAIMDPDIASIKLECSTSKPISTKLLSVRPDWNQSDPTAPDYIANKPFGMLPIINWENEDYSYVYDSSEEEDDPGCIFTLNDRGILECLNFKTPEYIRGIYSQESPALMGATYQLSVDLKIPTGTSEYSYTRIHFHGDFHSTEENYNYDYSEYGKEQYIGNLYLRDVSLPNTGEPYLFYINAGGSDWKTHEKEVIAVYLDPNGRFYYDYEDFVDQREDYSKNLSSYISYMTGENTYKYPRNIEITLGVPDIHFQGLPEEFLPTEFLENMEELEDEVYELSRNMVTSDNLVQNIKNASVKSYSSRQFPTVEAVRKYVSGDTTQNILQGTGYRFKTHKAHHYDVISFTPGYYTFNCGSTQYDENFDTADGGVQSANINEITFSLEDNLASINVLKNYGSTYTYKLNNTVDSNNTNIPFVKSINSNNSNIRTYYFLTPETDGGSSGGNFYLSSNTSENFMYTAGESIYTAIDIINIADFNKNVHEGYTLTVKHDIPSTTNTVPAATLTRTGNVFKNGEDFYIGNLSLKDASQTDTSEDFLVYWQAASGNVSFFLKSDAQLDGVTDTLAASNIAQKPSVTSLTSDVVANNYTSSIVYFETSSNTFNKLEINPGIEIPRFITAQMFQYQNNFYVVSVSTRNAEGTSVDNPDVYKISVDTSNKVSAVEKIATNVAYNSRYYNNVVLAGSRLYFVAYDTIESYCNAYYCKYLDLTEDDLMWRFTKYTEELGRWFSAGAGLAQIPRLIAIGTTIVSLSDGSIAIWDTLSGKYKINALENGIGSAIACYIDNTIITQHTSNKFGALNTNEGEVDMGYVKIDSALLTSSNSPDTNTVIFEDPAYEIDLSNATYKLIQDYAARTQGSLSSNIMSFTLSSTKEPINFPQADKTYRCNLSSAFWPGYPSNQFTKAFSIDRTFKFKEILPIECCYYLTGNSSKYVYTPYLMYAGNRYLSTGNPLDDTGEDFYITAMLPPPEGYTKRDNYIVTFCMSIDTLKNAGFDINIVSNSASTGNSQFKYHAKLFEITNDVQINTKSQKGTPLSYTTEELVNSSIAKAFNYEIKNLKTAELPRAVETDEIIWRVFNINGDIYFQNITDALFKFNPTTLTCERVAQLKGCYSNPVVVQNCLYYCSNGSLYCFDTCTNTESKLKTYSNSFWLIAHNGILYMFTDTANGGYLGAYDTTSHSTYTSRVYIPHGVHSGHQFNGVIVNNKIYDFGYNNSGNKNTEILIYDLKSGEVSKSKARFAHDLVNQNIFVFGNKIYLYGGYDRVLLDSDKPLAHAECKQMYVYDTITDQIESVDLSFDSRYKPVMINSNTVWLFHTSTNKIISIQPELLPKTNVITESSTDLEMPTAKSTYDLVNTRIGQNYTVLNDVETNLPYVLQIKNGELAIKALPTELRVTTLPDKLIYMQGEIFDPTGMVITAFYADGTSEEISDYKISALLNKVGYYNVEICAQVPSPIKCTLEVEVQEFNTEILQDFEYIQDFDGYYVITDWKQTLNGEPSTEMVIPDNTLIKF